MRVYLRPKRWTTDEVISEDTLAVTVAEVKKAARMDAGDSLLDDTIEGNIKAVQKKIERYCGITLFETRFIGWYDEFPVVMRINKKPNPIIDYIKYVDLKGDLQTLDTGIYQLQEFESYSNIFEAPYKVYPSVKTFTADSVRIAVIAGWEDAEAIPDDIKSAIVSSVVKMLTGDCGDNKILTKGAIELLSTYRNTTVWMEN